MDDSQNNGSHESSTRNYGKTAYIMEAGDWIVNKLTNKMYARIVD